MVNKSNVDRSGDCKVEDRFCGSHDTGIAKLFRSVIWGFIAFRYGEMSYLFCYKNTLKYGILCVCHVSSKAAQSSTYIQRSVYN